jgi:hypothetical protein
MESMREARLVLTTLIVGHARMHSSDPLLKEEAINYLIVALQSRGIVEL